MAIKPTPASMPQDCQGALDGAIVQKHADLERMVPQEMMTVGRGTEQIASRKNRKMFARCIRECGDDKALGELRFHECLSKKRKAKRDRRRQRQDVEVPPPKLESCREVVRRKWKQLRMVPVKPAPSAAQIAAKLAKMTWKLVFKCFLPRLQ